MLFSKKNDPLVIISETEIVIKNYYFKFSSVYKNPVILASMINELCLSYTGIYIIINNNEVIFFDESNNLYSNQLEFFARQNNIPITDRLDSWYCILRASEFKYARYLIEKCGFSKTLLMSILKKDIPFLISSNDWDEGLDHKNMMLNIFFRMTRERYWYTMSIALYGWINNRIS